MQETLVKNDKCFVYKVNLAKITPYWLAGKYDFDNINGSGKKGFLKTYSILSDVNKSFEELSLTDPKNTKAYLVEEGKDKNHCNVTCFFEYQDTFIEDKEKWIETESFRDVVKHNSTSLDSEYLKLFFKQCIVVNKP